MHNSRTKFRKIKNLSNKFLNNIKFKIEAFSFSKIVILTGVIISFISLFMNNITDLGQYDLNGITKITSIIIVIILIIILFLLFSYNKKEIIKKASNIVFRDYIIIIFLSIILFVITLNNLGIIIGLQTFDSNIKYGNGIIMTFVSSIFLFIGAILLKNDYHTGNNIYLNDSPEKKLEEIEKNNTKLPF